MDAIRNPEPGNVAKRTKEIVANREAAERLWKDYALTYLTPEEKRLVDQYESANEQYITRGIKAALDKLKLGDIPGANELAGGQISKAAPTYTELLEKLMALQVRVAEEIYTSAQASFQRLKAVLACAVLAGLLIGAAAGWFITRRLTRQLGAEPSELAEVSQAIAAGDLSQNHCGKLHQGSVMDAMQRMRSALVEVVGAVRAGVDNVAQRECPNITRQQRPQQSYRRAGLQPSANGCVHRGTEQHGGKQR
jgi:methyl-accepting chemotaxis protein